MHRKRKRPRPSTHALNLGWMVSVRLLGRSLAPADVDLSPPPCPGMRPSLSREARFGHQLHFLQCPVPGPGHTRPLLAVRPKVAHPSPVSSASRGRERDTPFPSRDNARFSLQPQLSLLSRQATRRGALHLQQTQSLFPTSLYCFPV